MDEQFDYDANGFEFLKWKDGWTTIYFDKDGNELVRDKLILHIMSPSFECPKYKKCLTFNGFILDTII